MDDDAFIRGICEAGTDSLPKLMYSDYLQERGRNDEANFWRRAANAGWEPLQLKISECEWDWWDKDHSEPYSDVDFSGIDRQLIEAMKFADGRVIKLYSRTSNHVSFVTKGDAWEALRDAWIAVEKVKIVYGTRLVKNSDGTLRKAEDGEEPWAVALGEPDAVGGVQVEILLPHPFTGWKFYLLTRNPAIPPP